MDIIVNVVIIKKEIKIARKMSSAVEMVKALENALEGEKFDASWFVEIERINLELAKAGIPPLINLDLMKEMAEVKANPEKYNRSLPPVPAGSEVLIDITGRFPPRMVKVEV